MKLFVAALFLHLLATMASPQTTSQTPPRKTQNGGMRDFGDGGETGRERAVENRDGTASEPAGSCTHHLGAHRRGWPLRVKGNRSRALPAEGEPHRFCDPR